MHSQDLLEEEEKKNKGVNGIKVARAQQSFCVCKKL